MGQLNEKALLARSSPAGLAWWASGGREGESMWLPAPHLRLLSQRIVEVATGRCPRLMVFMPPRHGKSELISKFTPAWFLGNFPHRKVMLTSYADGFAASWGRRARDVFAECANPLWGLDVNKETAGGQQWEVAGHNGIMVTAGVGGGLTGKGADLLIIDDPVKNAEDAASETIQAKHIDWWKSTARTRLQKGAGVILVMTRWHEADLAGQLLAEMADGEGDRWEILCLPGFAEERNFATFPSSRSLDLGPDALGRAPGQALWPEMFDSEALEQTRRAMGSYWFGAMYQQQPRPAEGMLFKKANFRYFQREGGGLATLIRDDGPHLFDTGYGLKFCTVDVAQSEKQSADFTVVATWVVTDTRDLLLWSLERVQFAGPNVKPLVRRVFYEQRPSFMAVEDKAFGSVVLQELVAEGIPAVPLKADADKVTRALPAVARTEEHRVFFPLGEPWVDVELEPELLAFPNAAHDDQVDALAYAAMQLPYLAPPIDHKRGGEARGSGDTLTGGLLSAQL